MLVIHDAGWTGNFLRSKEGVNQGGPMSIITYGIVIFPLIREIRVDHLEVLQPC